MQQWKILWVLIKSKPVKLFDAKNDIQVVRNIQVEDATLTISHIGMTFQEKRIRFETLFNPLVCQSDSGAQGDDPNPAKAKQNVLMKDERRKIINNE